MSLSGDLGLPQPRATRRLVATYRHRKSVER